MKTTRNGYKYTEHSRYGDFAVMIGCNTKYENCRDTFEVWKVRRHKKDHTFPNGTIVKAGTELAPSNEQWGLYGWTLTTLDSAIDFASSKVFDESIKETN